MAATLDEILAKAKKKTSQSNKERTAKPQDGKSVWRILPGWDEKNPFQFYHDYGQHFIKDLGGKLKYVIGCPDMTFGQPCDVCDMLRDAMQEAPTDEIRDKIKESTSKQRYLMNAINDKEPNKVVILEVGTMLFGQILETLGEYPNLFDPVKGQDIVITREGTGLNTKYSMTPRSAERSMKVPKSALMQLNNLTDYVTEDFEAKKVKAFAAIGAFTGIAPPDSSRMLSAPGAEDSYEDDEIDDEIPDAKDEDEIEDADILDAEILDDDVLADADDEDAKAEAEAEAKLAKIKAAKAAKAKAAKAAEAKAAKEAEASEEEKQKAEEGFDADVSDEDLDALLKDL